MRKALMLACASALALTACSPEAEDQARTSDSAADVEIFEPARTAEAAQRVTEGVTTAPPPKLQARSAPSSIDGLVPAQAAPPPANAPRSEVVDQPRPEPLAPVASIAYAFRYVMSAPSDRGAELMSRHEFACVSAGPGLCQVVSAQADRTSNRPGGRLEMRGQPQWINQFRAGLALDAANAGGRLEEALTQGEDVTRGIDEAETGAKTTASLADRIRELQQRRGGTMAQRLEIERQLSQLQRLRDEQEIQLRELNGRVQSATLTLDYREGGMLGAHSPTRPVAKALQNAFGLSMGMLAVLITAGSVILPIAVIGGAVWWAITRRRRAIVAS